MVSNEHRLYHALSKFVMDWTIKENKKGRRPFQSEIVGALEMVKSDIYAIHSIDGLLKNKLGEILKALNGKSIKIDNSGITVEITKESGIGGKEDGNETGNQNGNERQTNFMAKRKTTKNEKR